MSAQQPTVREGERNVDCRRGFLLTIDRFAYDKVRMEANVGNCKSLLERVLASDRNIIFVSLVVVDGSTSQVSCK